MFAWTNGYEHTWLRGDLIAGLTVWAVLVPEALAYATIAGVSPVVGLYAAAPALILYAAFASSRHVITATAMLVELADDLHRDGVELVIARDIGAVRDLLEHGDRSEAIRTFPSVQAAVSALER